MNKTHYYTRGRTIILFTALFSFLVTISLFITQLFYVGNTSLHSLWLLPANLIEHCLAASHFIALLIAFYGLFFRAEYKSYTFSWLDALAIAIVILLSYDFYYTLAFPHPLFNESYWI